MSGGDGLEKSCFGARVPSVVRDLQPPNGAGRQHAPFAGALEVPDRQGS